MRCNHLSEKGLKILFACPHRTRRRCTPCTGWSWCRRSRRWRGRRRRPWSCSSSRWWSVQFAGTSSRSGGRDKESLLLENNVFVPRNLPDWMDPRNVMALNSRHFWGHIIVCILDIWTRGHQRRIEGKIKEKVIQESEYSARKRGENYWDKW